MLKSFFAFEGIDGAGKSLQLKHCAKALQEMGVSVVTTCQPSHLPIGKLIRDALVNKLDFEETTLALLFAADRLEHLKEIESQLTDSLVLTDRYLLSSLAYNASALDKAWIESINRYATLKPKKTFLFDLDPKIALERIQKNRTTTEHYENLSHLEVIRQHYLDYAKVDESIILIDATKPITTLTDEIIEHIKPYL